LSNIVDSSLYKPLKLNRMGPTYL